MALALAASVLATGHNPAMGAAAEVEKPVRLAGTDRYATAVKIAEAYVTEVEGTTGRDDVSTAILTSGLDEHFGYTLPTPALAKLYNAPVLLTEPDELSTVVSTFLAKPAITTVYIVGNAEVVSAEVESQVAAISGVTDFALDGFTFGDSDITFVDGEPDGSDSIEPDRAVCDTITPGVRPGTLVARVRSGRGDGLPGTQSSALVRKGAITDFAGNPNARQTVSRFQSP